MSKKYFANNLFNRGLEIKNLIHKYKMPGSPEFSEKVTKIKNLKKEILTAFKSGDKETVKAKYLEKKQLFKELRVLKKAKGKK